MGDYSTYFIIAAAVLAVLGYLIGAKKVSLGPVVAVFALLILLSPFIFNSMIFFYNGTTQEVETPNVLGYASSEAVGILERAGLQAEIIGVSFSKEESGIVISQQPESGRVVKSGRTINLVISAKEKGVTVPNLIGKTSTDAESLISGLGLVIEEAFSSATTEAKGIVISQNPLPGTLLSKGASLSITISAGEIQ